MTKLREGAKLLVCLLASGSSGNSTYIETGHARVLVDAGLSCKTITSRLESIRKHPKQLDGIIVTHEHTDHIRGIGTLSRRYKIPVYMVKETHVIAQEKIGTVSQHHSIMPGEPFWIKDMWIEPFSIPHDAVNPIGIVARLNNCKLGITTDLGYPSNLVREKLKDCNMLVLESNHNVKMLLEGSYPWYLKQRIMSKTGHLSNDDSVNLLKKIVHPDLQHLFLAHLSEQNNRPELVQDLFRGTLEDMHYSHVVCEVASQYQPTGIGVLG
jgi:phosphoribosyl 1,2-cyclic phosphodiesterase